MNEIASYPSLKDKVVGSFKKLASWAAGKLRKIAQGVIKVVKKILKSNPAIDNANKILKLSGVKNLGESFLLEDKDEPVIYKTQNLNFPKNGAAFPKNDAAPFPQN